MADTVSSPLLRALSDRLNSLGSNNNNNTTFGDGETLSEIRTTISKIETLVRNKENRIYNNSSSSSNNESSSLHFRWLTEVKEFAYEIDDFVDEYEVIVLLQRRHSLCSSFSFPRREFAKLRNEMTRIMERLNQLLIIGFRFSVTKEGLDSDDAEQLYRDYYNLPSHLKQCFAYCSIFPEDYVINKEKLIRMWIAEEFVTLNDGDTHTLEEVGNDYFLELVRRSFFKQVSRDEDGEIVHFVVHYLVYELAQSVSSIECSIVEDGVSRNLSPKVRRCSLLSASVPLVIPQSLLEARNLRTLLLLQGKMDNISIVFERFSCLRVLDLSRSGINKLPATIGALKLLKYLDLSRTNIEYLPESIGNLKMLQTLDLSGCYNLRELSKAICSLTSLRCLDLRSCCLLTGMPSGVGKLGHLQKLPAFILGKNGAKIGELNGLNLRGRLEIKNLEYVRSVKDAEDAKLHEKESLHHLGLFWGHNVNKREAVSIELFESIILPRELKALDIVGYGGSVLPSWIMNQGLLSLVKLSLTNCSCEKLPPLGQLLYLEDLCIKGLSRVQIIGDEFYGDSVIAGFPSLKLLKLYNMSNLMEWRTEGEKDAASFLTSGESSNHTTKMTFPCLETLIVKGCNMLAHLPLIPNLKNLALWNSNPMLVRSLIHLKTLSSLVINGFRDPNFYVEFIWFIRNLTLYDCDDLISLLGDGMRGLNSLKKLSVLYCDKLMSLPEGLKHLTSLQKLDIVDCKRLAILPDIMQYLCSLEELVIEGCPLLNSLPDSICNLTSLRNLVIRKCPELERRLEKGTGEDWFKIAHVPSIEIECEQFISE